MSNDSHEAAVKAFMAEAKLNDPERFALVCSKHVVKTERQMRRIAEVEIPCAMYPGWIDWTQSVGGQIIAGVTEATYASLALGETA